MNALYVIGGVLIGAGTMNTVHISPDWAIGTFIGIVLVVISTVVEL